MKNKLQKSQSAYWLYGYHAVVAALNNPARVSRELMIVDPADIAGVKLPKGVKVTQTDRKSLDKMLTRDAVHQGIALRTEPVPTISLYELAERMLNKPKVKIVALDQVLDPHNVGAILRSCAAFNVEALIMTGRHSPGETAVLAKAASGALESVPIVIVNNLVQALDALKKDQFWVLGLAGDANLTLQEVSLPERLVVVMGAEGAGMRRLTEEHCDYLARLPIAPKVESLNVSNACAVALYDLATYHRV
jgi:23S rRNA (guanosine2251-2'-O)-methyltransferase